MSTASNIQLGLKSFYNLSRWEDWMDTHLPTYRMVHLPVMFLMMVQSSFITPHVGVTKTGTIGEIHRLGQHKNSGCCGAAKGALGKLLNDQIIAGNVTELDYQMNTIEQICSSKKSSNNCFIPFIRSN
jgi:hypothetical protein